MSSNVTLAVGGSRMVVGDSDCSTCPDGRTRPTNYGLSGTWAALPRGRAMRSLLPWATETQGSVPGPVLTGCHAAADRPIDSARSYVHDMFSSEVSHEHAPQTI